MYIQVNIILRALELYGFNLEYMLNEHDIPEENKEEKKALLKYTYEQVLTTQAEQINGKRGTNADNITEINKILEKNSNKDILEKVKFKII